MKFTFLRKKYPKFVYENFGWKIINNDLKIVFYFSIVLRQAQDNPERSRRVEPGIKFKPEIIIRNIDKKRLAEIGDRVLNNLAFHLGLMEIPSYWKATCSSLIEIRAGNLNKNQIKWWKDLIMNGMGQFFYENKINFRKPDFLQIVSSNSEQNLERPDLRKLKNRVLVPVGGGKDSIVTLEKLKERRKELNAFVVNPTKVARKVLNVVGIENPIVVERKIDPQLLELNKKGYLNGHTPITAVLSFLSVFCAILFDYKNIAFSNEKSANEGNLKYLGKIINHQWSKSFEFEKKFHNYCKKYLAKNVNYFSFLRQYTELEIAEMFTKYRRYFPIFSSCNVVVAEKLRKRPASAKSYGEARWCGKCSKCLFAFLILYPFVAEKELLKIFGKNLFEDRTLLPIMRQLMGEKGFKPFECVGTKKESRRAFELSLRKAKRLGNVPYLLTKMK